MYKVKLQKFEGPLDLLLFFIRRDELDIYDIPISKITQEFIDYMKLIQTLDLEAAGDFILMASTLMQIKVRMLLPKEVDEKGEEIDPRADLVKALLEYIRYKETAEEFSFLEANQRKVNLRGNFSEDVKESGPELSTLLRNITVYDLAKAFKKAIDQRPKEVVHEVKKFSVTIDEQIEFIMGLFTEEKKEAHFLSFAVHMTEKLRIVVTFVAILELIKDGRIGIRETSNFNDFVIYKIEDGQDIQLNN
ncbi:MAG TPA: segregation/condensation protein A [Ignavibacteriales bacterium]|nr:segregation/condensation protein A [Ignavibacteriales bacterium]